VKLAIAADEISFDFETAVSLGIEWGVGCFELKRLSRRRVPDVDETDIAVVERVVQDTGVTLTSLSPGLFKDPLTPGAVADGMDRLQRSLALAQRLGVNRIVTFGFARGTDALEPGLERVTEILGIAAEHAGREGVTLMLENEPAYLVDTPRSAATVVEAVDSPSLRLNWDPCNALGADAEAPFPDGYDVVRPHVAHVHVKDGRVRPDGTVEYTVLGTGEVDWLGQLRALHADGYQGYCVLEPHFGNRVASSRSAVAAARDLLRQASEVTAP
jgi:sugar phosphate isomerase/epimerase